MPEYAETFTNGNGEWHICSICGGSISESESLTIADGQTQHTHCFDDAS